MTRVQVEPAVWIREAHHAVQGEGARISTKYLQNIYNIYTISTQYLHDIYTIFRLLYYLQVPGGQETGQKVMLVTPERTSVLECTESSQTFR